jgi:chromosome segregation ATPase
MASFTGGLAIVDTSLRLASTAYNAAKWLWTTANGIKKAPELWKSIEEDLNNTKAKIELLIETVKKITEGSVPNSSSIVTLKSLKGKLEADLENIKSRPQKEELTNKRLRVSFAVTGKGNLRELLGQLETHASDLLAWLLLYDSVTAHGGGLWRRTSWTKECSRATARKPRF